MSQASPDHPANRLWTIDFVLNLLTAHFLFSSYAGLFTVVPSYVLDRGGQEWQIGIVVGSFGVVSLLIRPYAGRWINLLGTKRVAVVGTAILGIGALMYIPAASVWWLVPVRMVQGVGLAMAPVATTTTVANLAPAHRRAEAMAYMGNSIAVSSLYAPVLGFWLLSRYGFSASFVFSAASALLACLLALGISAARTRVPVGDASSKSVPLISRAALFPTAVFLGYTITVAPVNSFLPLLAESRDLGNPGLFFTVNSFTTMIVMLAAGPFSDRVGRGAVIVPGLLSAASAMLLLMSASNRWMFLGGAFLTGAGFGLIQPGIQSLTIDRVAPRERSSAMATLQSAWDIGGSGGAFVLGPIAGALGVGATFGIASVGAFLSAAGFIPASARTRQDRSLGADPPASE